MKSEGEEKMLLRKKAKFLALLLCSLITVGFSAKDSSAARVCEVSNVVVSNLRVRAYSNVNSEILYTLANGKDLVYRETPTNDGDSLRSWSNFAYPNASVGKYSKNVTGWVCTWQDGSYYVKDTKNTTFHVGSWLYNDSALTVKHKYIPAGTIVVNMGGVNTNIKHSSTNLNLWNIKTFDDNAGTGASPKTRYFNGWLANAS